jgi:hypothetical protein
MYVGNGRKYKDYNAAAKKIFILILANNRNWMTFFKNGNKRVKSPNGNFLKH